MQFCADQLGENLSSFSLLYVDNFCKYDVSTTRRREEIVGLVWQSHSTRLEPKRQGHRELQGLEPLGWFDFRRDSECRFLVDPEIESKIACFCPLAKQIFHVRQFWYLNVSHIFWFGLISFWDDSNMSTVNIKRNITRCQHVSQPILADNIIPHPSEDTNCETTWPSGE